MRRITIVVAVLLTATAAMAADLFTLQIPVTVSHLHPDITQVEVDCWLNGRTGPSATPTHWGGMKFVRFPVTRGSFTGTATIVWRTEDFTPTELPLLSDVFSGDCQLGLITPTGSYIAYSGIRGDHPAYTDHVTGTPFSTQVHFTIP